MLQGVFTVPVINGVWQRGESPSEAKGKKGGRGTMSTSTTTAIKGNQDLHPQRVRLNSIIMCFEFVTL